MRGLLAPVEAQRAIRRLARAAVARPPRPTGRCSARVSSPESSSSSGARATRHHHRHVVAPPRVLARSQERGGERRVARDLDPGDRRPGSTTSAMPSRCRHQQRLRIAIRRRYSCDLGMLWPDDSTLCETMARRVGPSSRWQAAMLPTPAKASRAARSLVPARPGERRHPASLPPQPARARGRGSRIALASRSASWSTSSGALRGARARVEPVAEAVRRPGTWRRRSMLFHRPTRRRTTLSPASWAAQDRAQCRTGVFGGRSASRSHIDHAQDGAAPGCAPCRHVELVGEPAHGAQAGAGRPGQWKRRRDALPARIAPCRGPESMASISMPASHRRGATSERRDDAPPPRVLQHIGDAPRSPRSPRLRRASRRSPGVAPCAAAPHARPRRGSCPRCGSRPRNRRMHSG